MNLKYSTLIALFIALIYIDGGNCYGYFSDDGAYYSNGIRYTNVYVKEGYITCAEIKSYFNGDHYQLPLKCAEYMGVDCEVSIPKEGRAYCPNYVYSITLENFNLQTYPEIFKRAYFLEYINLAGNKLTSDVFKEINPSITNLDLSGNQLNWIPDDIERLTKLQVLDAHNNRIKSISNKILNLKSLNKMFLSDNCLTNVSNDITSRFSVLYDNNSPNCSAVENRCGPEFGYCLSGQCCSKLNYCGTTSAHCSNSKGCQSEFGECRCGKTFGKCPSGYCCSKYDYCGKTKAYCSAAKGCQKKYGKSCVN